MSQPFIHTDVNGYSGRGEVQAGRTYDEGGTDDSEGGGLRVQLRAATVSLSTARPGCEQAT